MKSFSKKLKYFHVKNLLAIYVFKYAINISFLHNHLSVSAEFSLKERPLDLSNYRKFAQLIIPFHTMFVWNICIMLGLSGSCSKSVEFLCLTTGWAWWRLYLT